MRVLGRFDAVLDGTRNLREAGVPIEVNFSPTRFNIHEIASVVALAHELGAASFYSGRTMYTGNAVKAWRHIAAARTGCQPGARGMAPGPWAWVGHRI